jgi:hypothetical protein
LNKKLWNNSLFQWKKINQDQWKEGWMDHYLSNSTRFSAMGFPHVEYPSILALANHINQSITCGRRLLGHLVGTTHQWTALVLLLLRLLLQHPHCPAQGLLLLVILLLLTLLQARRRPRVGQRWGSQLVGWAGSESVQDHRHLDGVGAGIDADAAAAVVVVLLGMGVAQWMLLLLVLIRDGGGWVVRRWRRILMVMGRRMDGGIWRKFNK